MERKLNRLTEVGEYIHITSCRKFWVMFDLSNGHPPEHGYIWIFPTKATALKHRSKQHKKEHGAKLSYPKLVRYESAKN